MTDHKLAALMQKRGQKAAVAAHRAIFAEIDKAEHLDDARKTGAAVYAATMLYAGFLNTLVQGGEEYNNVKALAFGLFGSECADKLIGLAKFKNEI